jgi:cell division protease FtsH
LIAEAYRRTRALLEEKRTSVEILAKELLAKEILFQSDLERLIGKRPFEHKTTYEEFMDRKPAEEIATEEQPDQNLTADLHEPETKTIESDEVVPTDSTKPEDHPPTP